MKNTYEEIDRRCVDNRKQHRTLRHLTSYYIDIVAENTPAGEHAKRFISSTAGESGNTVHHYNVTAQ